MGPLGDTLRSDAAVADGVEAQLAAAEEEIAALKAELAACLDPFDLASYCRGVWALKQVTTPTSIDAGDITTALNTPGVRGFAARFGWSSIADATGHLQPSSLDAARARATNAGVELSVRFMAGRYLPAALYDAMGTDYYYTLTTQDPGARVPLPFSKKGTVGNPVFEDAFARLTSELAAWCRTNDVHLLHLPWYGRLWAEYNADAEIQAVPGWLTQRCIDGNLKLMDAAHPLTGDDLAVSFTSSGLFANNTATTIPNANRDHMVALWGASPQIQTLLTGLGKYQNVGDTINPGGSQDVYDGMQMYDGANVGYDWSGLFSTCYSSGINWIEVYTPSFTYSDAPALASAVGAFNADWGIG